MLSIPIDRRTPLARAMLAAADVLWVDEGEGFCSSVLRGANHRAVAPVERCTARSANSCADCGARNGAGYCRMVRRHSANLLVRKLPAIVIVVAELLETFARAGEGHYAGAGRNAGAGGQRGYRHQG